MGARRVPLHERFWAKVDKTDECWLWTGARNGDGYGYIQVEGRSTRAHGWSYLWACGAVPVGLVLDHLCRVRHCVRPDHLQPVPERINLLRGESFAAENAVKTHCPAGHEYDEANTARDSRGSRYCRACKRRKAAERRHASSSSLRM